MIVLPSNNSMVHKLSLEFPGRLRADPLSSRKRRRSDKATVSAAETIFVMNSGEVVERMLLSAEKVFREVEQEFRISHVVAGFSSGDDSMVSTHWAMTRFPSAVVMTGDTKIGLRLSREHAAAVCVKMQWDREVVSPEPEGPPEGWDRDWTDAPTSYEEFVRNHGFPGPGQHGRMYQRLKQRAFRKIKARVGERPKGSRIMVVSGIRGDESAVRAGYRRAFMEEPKEGFVWVNPFYWHTAADFEAYRQEFGLPRNPAKRKVGISGECCCGAFAAPGEREAYRAAEPEFADYLDNLEVEVMERFPWSWESGPPRWWVQANKDSKCGQLHLFDATPEFRPACVGCHRRGAS